MNTEPPRRKPASAQDIKVTTGSESTLGLEMMAWVEVHKQKLMVAGAVALAVIIAAVIYNHYTAQREMQASEALLALRAPIIGENRGKTAPSDKLLALAEGFAGTTAGRHALLQAGEALYLEGKYDQARSVFQRFVTENVGHPLVPQAELGMAACLDAAGKRKEAIEAYDLVRKRWAMEGAVVSQAKLALGRLYEAEGKLEQAHGMYLEILESMKTGFNTWAMEAQMRLAALEKAHPALKDARLQKMAAAAAAQQPRPQNVITLTNVNVNAPKPAPAPAPAPAKK
ncbi:tetratricopeptide repeat protein [Fontisphaera persica]|uniref:tetratricopeptide repeat protein n=1 Tax=Fontisphaera persica TaxID=2974023 RepID=UPI0024BF8B82|nr:tetratricopeptide repeat protein [Fontisphaera persica]WCJ58790.1 tetratricopeptide repeat protein [Fontisphaera persica]